MTKNEVVHIKESGMIIKPRLSSMHAYLEKQIPS